MPVTPYMAKAMLDWCLGGAAATQPAGRFIAFATGIPNASGASDGVATRMTVTFAGANSPQASVTNLNTLLQTVTVVATFTGWTLYDALAGGNRLAYGTFTANMGCRSADTPQVNSGALTITLA